MLLVVSYLSLIESSKLNYVFFFIIIHSESHFQCFLIFCELTFAILSNSLNFIECCEFFSFFFFSKRTWGVPVVGKLWYPGRYDISLRICFAHLGQHCTLFASVSANPNPCTQLSTSIQILVSYTDTSRVSAFRCLLVKPCWQFV